MDEFQDILNSGNLADESLAELAVQIVSALETARRDLRHVSLEETKLWMVCAGRLRRRPERDLPNELMSSR